jgi:hypothetical protein
MIAHSGGNNREQGENGSGTEHKISLILEGELTCRDVDDEKGCNNYSNLTEVKVEMLED